MTLRPKFLNKLALIGSFRILQTRNTIIGKIADWFGFSSFSRTVILPTMEFKPSKFSCKLTAGQLRQKKFCGFVPGGLEPKKFVPERAQLRPVAARRRHWVRRGASKRRRDQMAATSSLTSTALLEEANAVHRSNSSSPLNLSVDADDSQPDSSIGTIDSKVASSSIF